MTLAAVIPARGGSRRIPRKNIREFYGVPVIYYAISAARSVKASPIIVSTDDDDIDATARNVDVDVTIHERNEYDARDEVGTQDVVRRVIADCDITTDLTLCIYPASSPLIVGYMDGKIGQAIRILREEPYTRYVYTVAAKGLRDIGHWYLGRTQAFADGAPLVSPRSRLMQIRSPFDIDVNTEEDWQAMEAAWQQSPRRQS